MVKKSNQQEILQYLDACTSTYGARPMTDDAKAIWMAILSRYSRDQIVGAFQKHLSTSVYMPKPADIVTIIDGDPTDRASVAWMKVINAIREVGDYSSICFDDPVIHAVISNMGGWVKLCHIREQEVPFVEKAFVQHYKAFKASDSARSMNDVPRYLSGTIALGNQSANRQEPEHVVMYGDQDMAELVFRQGNDGVKYRLSHVSGAKSASVLRLGHSV